MAWRRTKNLRITPSFLLLGVAFLDCDRSEQAFEVQHQSNYRWILKAGFHQMPKGGCPPWICKKSGTYGSRLNKGPLFSLFHNYFIPELMGITTHLFLQLFE